MSDGYIDPKKIAQIGEALLEEAILAVLAEAYVQSPHDHERHLPKAEISERAGIYMLPNWRSQNGIVDMLAAKLEIKGRLSIRDKTLDLTGTPPIGKIDGCWLDRPSSNMEHHEKYSPDVA